MDIFDMIGYIKSGFNCSQLMNVLVMEARGEENPALTKALWALGGGLGYTGNNCGCLAGGACALVRCLPDEATSFEKRDVVREFISWFEENYGTINCIDITDKDFRKAREETCPPIMLACYEKIMEMLYERELIE